jgi:hypothetical protein
MQTENVIAWFILCSIIWWQYLKKTRQYTDPRIKQFAIRNWYYTRDSVWCFVHTMTTANCDVHNQCAVLHFRILGTANATHVTVYCASYICRHLCFSVTEDTSATSRSSREQFLFLCKTHICCQTWRSNSGVDKESIRAYDDVSADSYQTTRRHILEEIKNASLY